MSNHPHFPHRLRCARQALLAALAGLLVLFVLMVTGVVQIGGTIDSMPGGHVENSVQISFTPLGSYRFAGHHPGWHWAGWLTGDCNPCEW